MPSFRKELPNSQPKNMILQAITGSLLYVSLERIKKSFEILFTLWEKVFSKKKSYLKSRQQKPTSKTVSYSES